jgi:hypothetical protein
MPSSPSGENMGHHSTLLHLAYGEAKARSSRATSKSNVTSTHSLRDLDVTHTSRVA